MNRGVEIAAEVADLPASVITDQVRNGVAVRMAVLFLLLGAGAELDGAACAERAGRRTRRGPTRASSGAARWSTPTGERRADVLDRRRAHRRRRAPTSTRPAAPRCSTPAAASSAPGLVDLHTHLREPGREEAETVETGSRAAALGGYTAVVAMPNTEPAIDSRRGGPRGARARPPTALLRGGVAGAITVGRAGEQLAPDGRAGRPRGAPVHRRRHRGAGRRPDAPGPGVRRRPRA